MAIILCPTKGCGFLFDPLADICPNCALIAPGGAYTRYFPADRRYMICRSCAMPIIPGNGRLFDRAGCLNDGGICANCLRANPTTTRAEDLPMSSDRWCWRVRQASPVWASLGLYLCLYAYPAILIWGGGNAPTYFAALRAVFFTPHLLGLLAWASLLGIAYFGGQSIGALPALTDKAQRQPLFAYLWWFLTTEGISAAWNTAMGCLWCGLASTFLYALVTHHFAPGLVNAFASMTSYLLACWFVQLVISVHLLVLMVAGKFWPHLELWLRKQRGDFATGLCQRLARQHQYQ